MEEGSCGRGNHGTLYLTLRRAVVLPWCRLSSQRRISGVLEVLVVNLKVGLQGLGLDVS